MTTTIINHLRKYVQLSAATEDWLRQHTKTKELPKGGTLRLYPDDFIFLSSGLLKKVSDRYDQIYHFVSEDDFIIYPAAWEQMSFIALEDCSLRYIHHFELITLIRRDVQVLEAYTKLIRYWNMRRLDLLHFLHLSAASRKALFYERYGELAQRIPQKDIACYLGISPSYFSQL